MWESQKNEIPGEGCTSLPRVKFCLSTLRFLMGRTEGKNGSFPLLDLKKTEAMPKFLIVMCICGTGIFATFTVLRGTCWVP